MFYRPVEWSVFMCADISYASLSSSSSPPKRSHPCAIAEELFSPPTKRRKCESAGNFALLCKK